MENKMTREELLKTAKPILFNTEMVRAIQNGRKTVTRRLIKANLVEDGGYEYETDNGHYRHKLADCAAYKQCYDVEIKPPYKVGDYLYVRETWGIYEQSYMDAIYILYRADFPNGAKTFGADGVSCDLPTWRPSIHMPKEAARIFLRVTGVRVERLQDITDKQIVAEGCNIPITASDEERCLLAFARFPKLWNSTVKKSDLDRYGWDANPWVWVIEFERVKVTE